MNFAELEKKYSLPSGLLSSVMKVESGGVSDPNSAVSPAGAIGAFQFMPGTAKDLGIDPRNLDQAADGAARYLSSNLKRFGSLDLALAAYNAGPGNVAKANGVPNFPETKAYITKVKAAMKIDPTKVQWETPEKEQVTNAIDPSQVQWEEPVEERSFGENIGRQVGLTARAGIKGVAAIPAMIGDAIFSFGGESGRSSRALDQTLDILGLPRPETGTERVAGNVAGALTGMGGMATAAKLANPVSETGRGIANVLSSNLGGQAASTTASSGLSSLAGEAGGGAGMQIAAGLAGGVAVPLASGAVGNLSRNVLAKSIRKSEQTPFAAEGERLANTTGIDLPLGPRTGSKFATNLENTARQYAPTADRAQAVDIKLANQAIFRVETIANQISKTKTDPQKLGSAIENTIKSAAKSLDNARDASAKIDYGDVRNIAGPGKVIRLNSFVDELNGIIDDYTNVAGSDASKIVSQARAAVSRLTGTIQKEVPDRVLKTPTGKPIKLFGTEKETGTIDNTIDEAMRTRRFYGKAARGEGNVFDDISPNLNRSLAGRLFRSVNQDFDNAAEASSGALSDALKKANGNFRKFSQSIEYLEKSALGKMVGDDVVDAAVSGNAISTTAGEAITQRLGNMHPSTRMESMKIISQWNPGLAKDIRSFFLGDALERGMAIGASAKGSSQVPISFSKFISALSSEKAGSQRILESYGFSKAEIADIRDVSAAMMRAGDKTGFNFSNTNVASENMEFIGSAAHAATTGMTWGWTAGLRALASGSVRLAAKRVGLNRIIASMESASGREALKTVVNPKASPAAIAAAFEVIESDQQQ